MCHFEYTCPKSHRQFIVSNLWFVRILLSRIKALDSNVHPVQSCHLLHARHLQSFLCESGRLFRVLSVVIPNLQASTAFKKQVPEYSILQLLMWSGITHKYDEFHSPFSYLASKAHCFSLNFIRNPSLLYQVISMLILILNQVSF